MKKQDNFVDTFAKWAEGQDATTDALREALESVKGNKLPNIKDGLFNCVQNGSNPKQVFKK